MTDRVVPRARTQQRDASLESYIKQREKLNQCCINKFYQKTLQSKSSRFAFYQFVQRDLFEALEILIQASNNEDAIIMIENINY